VQENVPVNTSNAPVVNKVKQSPVYLHSDDLQSAYTKATEHQQISLIFDPLI